LHETTNTLVNVYGPNTDDPQFFSQMFCKLNDFSVNNAIIGGDFNAVLNNSLDKLNGPPHKNTNSRVEILNYMKILNSIDVYSDLHPSVKQFTRYQNNPVIASRLDFFNL